MTARPIAVDAERQRVRSRVRMQLGLEALAVVLGGVLGGLAAGAALSEATDDVGSAVFFVCCGASLALLLGVVIISVVNSTRGAVRSPLVQALPVPRRRQTTREIRHYVAGGPPPTVDVFTARAVALAVTETRWMFGFFVALALLQAGLFGIAGPLGLAFAAGAGLLLIAGAGFLARDTRAAESFLDRHPG